MINQQIKNNIETYNQHVKEYPALHRAASVLSEPSAPILGREHELHDLRLGLRNPEKANVILLGEPGSGKSAIVQGLTYDNDSAQYLTLSVDVERLAQDANADKDAEMANGLLDLVAETKAFSRKYNIIVILFIDEFHRIAMISQTSVESLKPILEKSALNGFRIIAATTFEEYNDWIAPNRALDQRLLRMDLPELPREAVMNILRSRASQYGVSDFASETIYGEIYDTSKQILLSNSQPRASLDILLNMVGNITKTEYMANGELVREYATPEELNINSEYALSRPMLNRVIQRAYGIDIDNRIDVASVREALTTRIYNQHQAVDLIMSRLELSLAGFNDPTRPKISFLSTGPTGVGKALLDSEMIPVVGGYKRNGDLVVGDYVFNRHGQPIRVSGVYPQGLKDLYRVTFADGRMKDCADEHLWTFFDSVTQEWTVQNTLDMMARLDAGRMLMIHQSDAVERDEQVYEMSPYEFGSLLGNGSKSLDDLSIEYAHIPENYKLGSIDQRFMLIQGLMDTSGMIDDAYHVSYTSRFYQLAEDVAEVFRSLGIRVDVTTTEKGYRLAIRCRNDMKWLMFLIDADKRTIAKQAEDIPDKGLFDVVEVVSVKRVGPKASMTCIMVDDEEHLYLAGRDYVVTHNTELAKVISEALGIPLKRFDMSRYPRPEDAVDFADQLANAAWSAPNAYILIDEAEKSTRECMNILLQVLDDARLTSPNNANRVISFSGNIINLTTNLGSEVYQHQSRFSDKKEIDTELVYKSLSESDQFETAVLGRIDVIVPFIALPRTALAHIAENELKFNLAIAETSKRQIFISPDILPYIVIDRTSKDTERGGARDAKRNVKNIVIQKIATYMASNKNEVPLVVRLATTPRFRDTSIADPEAASVEVVECWDKDTVAGWLNALSDKVGRKLVDNGLFVPRTINQYDRFGTKTGTIPMTGSMFLKDHILPLIQGPTRSTSFKSTFDVDRFVVIDGNASIDVANVTSYI